MVLKAVSWLWGGHGTRTGLIRKVRKAHAAMLSC